MCVKELGLLVSHHPDIWKGFCQKSPAQSKSCWNYKVQNYFVVILMLDKGLDN